MTAQSRGRKETLMNLVFDLESGSFIEVNPLYADLDELFGADIWDVLDPQDIWPSSWFA